MTLVVAHPISTGIRITSDMRVTDPSRTRVPSPMNAALKAVVVHPRVCVAFAGDPVEVALDAIRGLELDHDSAPDAAHICSLLLAAQERANVDFLVAALEPTALFKVKGGTAESVRTGWIGSHSAFEEFQRVFTAETYVSREIQEWAAAFAPGQDPEALARPVFDPRPFDHLRDRPIGDYEITIRATTAMREVIASQLPDVGEATISVVPDKGVFAYRESVMRVLGRDIRLGEATTESGSQRGDLSYTILVPEKPGVGAVGIYFLEGKLGLLYHPTKWDCPQQHRGASLSEFSAAVQDEHGISLSGAGL